MEYIQINLKKDDEIITISILPSEIDILRQYTKKGYKIVYIF